MTLNLTRRKFIKVNGVGSLLAMAGSISLSREPRNSGFVHVKPRYYRWHVNEGQEWTELNTGYATLDWKIPLSQCALVLVDVWQRHYIREPEERAERIIDENLLPLMKACRSQGLEVTHAPAPEAARIHPNYVNIPEPPRPPADDW